MRFLYGIVIALLCALAPFFEAKANGPAYCALATSKTGQAGQVMDLKRLEKESLDLLTKLDLRQAEGKTGKGDKAGIEAKLELSKVIDGPQGTQLVILKLWHYIDGKRADEKQEFEVVALKDGKVVAFEEAVTIPKRVVARVHAVDFEVRYPKVLQDISYYIELTDKPSIIAALKSIYTGIRYWGFSGLVVPGKAEFDPTPNRTWKVVDARFSLSRGPSGEAGDIQAFHFDADFAGYTANAIKKPTSTGEEGAWVAPWGQGAIVEIIHQD